MFIHKGYLEKELPTHLIRLVLKSESRSTWTRKNEIRNRPWRKRYSVSLSLREKTPMEIIKITGRKGLGGRDVSQKTLE